MPELNPRQFTQEPLEGFYGASATPHGLKGRLPERAPTASVDDLGPDTKRGTVGQGQQMLNFDNPRRQLETAESGLVPIHGEVDPDWDESMWRIGGMKRIDPTTRSEDFGPYSGDQAEVITAGWERAPVETIGPDDEVRTGQGDTAYGEAPAHVWHEEDKVAEIREVGDDGFLDHMDNETPQLPWVAQVQGKRYLMEGHHRAMAARTRDEGSFPAHVLRGNNWGQIEEQIYDGPRER